MVLCRSFVAIKHAVMISVLVMLFIPMTDIADHLKSLLESSSLESFRIDSIALHEVSFFPGQLKDTVNGFH